MLITPLKTKHFSFFNLFRQNSHPALTVNSRKQVGRGMPFYNDAQNTFKKKMVVMVFKIGKKQMIFTMLKKHL
jgi:hypothetical protein